MAVPTAQHSLPPRQDNSSKTIISFGHFVYNALFFLFYMHALGPRRFLEDCLALERTAPVPA